jgi:FkbM family methyltransferase
LELSVLSLNEPIRALHLRTAVSADATRALSKLRNGKHGRGLFIDCGSNIGQGYSYFSRYYKREHYDYILIEPNVQCLPFLEALRADCGVHIEIIGKAASTTSGFARLFGPPSGRGDPTYQGRSIVAEHNSSFYDNVDATEDVVETFSLSQLILEKRNSYDLIALKMDVEGAEYDILEDILESGAHRELFATYIEFHSLYMKQLERAAKRILEEKIKRSLESANVIFREWI